MILRIQLLGYFLSLRETVWHVAGTSGRAVVNDITLPNSNTRRDKLLREFSRNNPPRMNSIHCESKLYVQVRRRTSF